MECKVTGDTVLMFDTVFEGAAEQPVDVEFTLPDYCPDVGRVLKCRATPIILSRETGEKGIVVEGTARLEVLYADGHGGQVRCCTHDLPFTTTIAASGLPEDGRVHVEPRVDYINCRAVSQRRIDIHGAFTIRASVIYVRRSEVTSAAEGAGVLTRKQICDISTAAGHTQSAFTIGESFDLPDSKPAVAAVVRTCADAVLTECKPIANKLIVKGTAELTVVYCSNEGSLEHMTYSIPFSQFFDLIGADDESVCDAELSVSCVDLSLRTDSEGEYRRFTADIRCFADIKAYRSDTVSVISDAYSTLCELRLERKLMTLDRYIGGGSQKVRAEGRLNFPVGIAEVLDAWCEPIVSASGANGQVTGSALLCAVIRNEEGGCEYAETTCSFECALPDSGEDLYCRLRVSACGCDYSLSGRSGLELRGELRVQTSSFRRVQIPCVSTLEPDESRLRDDADTPAVVMYFASDGEELWDIAREHNTSAAAIAEDNGLTGERLTEKKLLLIARG